MKNKFNYVLKAVVLCLGLVFLGCETQEEIITNPESSKDYIVKKYSFKEFKSNPRAFEKLKQSRIAKNPSLQYKGVYNENYGVFIDTTNIVLIENGSRYSFTFKIINDDFNNSKIENLVINSIDGGGYSAYIAEYNLTQEELNKISNDEKLNDKVPSSLRNVSSTSSFPITGNGADCIELHTSTQTMCRNAEGNEIPTQGDLGDDCVGMSYEVENIVMIIDAGCLNSGGGGGNWQGEGNPGGYWDGGNWIGGGNSTGNDPNGGNGTLGGSNTNPPTGGNNSGNQENQDSSLTDPNGNPILTTPILTLNKTELKLLNELTPTQTNWWNAAPQNVKDNIIEYLTQNDFSEESQEFVKEMIDVCNENDATFVIDDTVTEDNALVFDNVSEFQNFLDSRSNLGTDFNYIQQQNEKIASTKFWIGAPYNGVKVNIKQNMSPTYSVTGVTTEMFGVTIFSDWHQSDYSVNTVGNIVTVNVYGVASIKIFFESVGTVYHENQHFQIKINKTTGDIISAVVIKD